MMARPEPTIPRHALRDGTVLCLSVASLRLEETDALLKHGLPTQAAVLFSFAVEEFGKAALLRQAVETGADSVLIGGFYDHRVKLAAAAKHVDPVFLRLTPGVFDPGVFDPQVFDTGRQIDFAARIAGMFVDWQQDRWVHGVRVDAATLEQSSRGLQLAIAKAMIDWT